MEPYEIVILVGSLLLILSGVMVFVHNSVYDKRKKRINDIFKNHFMEEIINWHHDRHLFQIDIETDKAVYLVKIVPIGFQNELIITNPTYWCINSDPAEWKRSSKPKLVEGVKPFLEFDPKIDKPTIKIALIYPGAHSISRYLNESDVELVDYKKAINGVFFVRFGELDDFLAGRD